MWCQVAETDAAHVLQVAASGGVVEHVSAITRYFCDFLPDFRGSSTHKEAQKRIEGLARSR